jgi:small subunit ribosomal protein S14
MIKDHKRRTLTAHHAIDRIRLNTVKRNNILPPELREVAGSELHNNFPRDSCFVRIRERCMLTSRPRGCVKKFRVSRIVFRDLADYNKLSGMQRAMW